MKHSTVYAIMAIVLVCATFAAGELSVVPRVSIAQVGQPTFVDLPQGAVETYPGSGLYKAPVSDGMTAAVNVLTQENWDRYHIAKESNLGLPLGSIYLKAQSGKYVELALYERAAFTIFHAKPARQILSTIIFEGRIQVTEDEFITLPGNIRSAFTKLYIAGEGTNSTPSVGTVAGLLSTDKSKAADASWTTAGLRASCHRGSAGPAAPPHDAGRECPHGC
jgi:hypothetical protein